MLLMLRKIKQSISYIDWSGHNQSLAMIKHVNETNQKSLWTITYLIK